MVQDCDGAIRLAARRVQEIEMRKLKPQVHDAEDLMARHPQLRGDIINMHTTGALPFSRGDPPTGPRALGLPYDPTKTVEMVKKIWKDVRVGRVLVVSSRVVGGNSPTIATPTTTAQKRLPDRTMSDDFRIISDLRFPNLFVSRRTTRK